jgi:hypothetical protein
MNPGTIFTLRDLVKAALWNAVDLLFYFEMTGITAHQHTGITGVLPAMHLTYFYLFDDHERVAMRRSLFVHSFKTHLMLRFKSHLFKLKFSPLGTKSTQRDHRMWST